MTATEMPRFRLVDAGPVREHVARLRRDGLGVRRIAQVAGVSHGVVSRLVYGSPHRGMGPSRRVRAEHAAVLLAVRPRLAHLGRRVDVDGTGARRRLQALVAIGWTNVRLAHELGVVHQRVQQLLAQDRVSAGTALDVRALYERLWDRPPVCRTVGEHDGARRARARAAAAGWAPPMAWDDDTIDDPNAGPELGAPASSLIDLDEFEWVRVAGVTLEEFARNHGVKPASVCSAMSRARNRAAVAS